MTGPRRRVNDHVHPEYWTSESHHRFEDRVAKQLESLQKEVREDVDGLRSDLNKASTRLAWLLGALGVAVFVVNIAVTIWIKFGIPVP